MDSSDASRLCILIVEDGDEYLENLQRFVPGPAYLQCHDGAEALAILGARAVDWVVLDMRFDRIAPERLVGDRDQVVRRHNGDVQRAVRYLQNHQGLFILDAVRRSGCRTPVVLASDFSGQEERFALLAARHGPLYWVPDDATAAQWAALWRSGA